MGERLRDRPEVKGRHNKKSHDAISSPTLADLGVDKHLSSRCQAIAEVPAGELEAIISDAMEKGRELTSRELPHGGRHDRMAPGWGQ
jgi:hypothetical protein